jgi:hypothetical protein
MVVRDSVFQMLFNPSSDTMDFLELIAFYFLSDHLAKMYVPLLLHFRYEYPKTVPT